MTASSVLAAAVALHDFTIPQLAAYCEADRAEILLVLSEAAELVKPIGPPDDEAEAVATHWRVVDAAGLRERIAARASMAASTSPTDPQSPNSRSRERLSEAASLRLIRAEETLVSCRHQPSPEVRRAMAVTAANYIRQSVAASTARHEWWDVEFTTEALTATSSLTDGEFSDQRLRVDVALADLTESEAVGRPVELDFLIEAGDQLPGLGESMTRPGLRDVVDRFLDLARHLTRLSVDDVPHSPAPTRLLSAVGWGQVLAEVEPDIVRASQQAVSMLHWLRDRPHPTEARNALFRFGDHLPNGWNRVTVYADLLQILPQQCEWHRQAEPVPGLIIEAVANGAAVQHLQRWAEELKANLVGAPYESDSALIGITAQVFDDFAAASRALDGEVIPRAAQARSRLLSLAGVAARSADRSTPTARPGVLELDG